MKRRTSWIWHRGSCHCGAVRFCVSAPRRLHAYACNCSICRKGGYVQLIVPASRFVLEQGAEQLTEYRFNTRVARHTFCRVCGIKPFYTPRSNPDGVAVNVYCLDDESIESITVEPFDGQHWEQHAPALRHLSQEDG